MNEALKYLHRDHAGELSSLELFRPEIAETVRTYHESFPEYEVTPLAKLDCLAGALGISGLYVKDESYRFGLNAFKVLGGGYAMGNYIAHRLGKDIKDLSYAELTSEETRKKLGDVTFVTATDGNHGRGVAWTANRLKQKSVVYMPKGSSLERLHNIQALGSNASITDVNYDDAVRMANEGAEKYGWILIQDTAWEGYEDVPTWIMQGYMTMADEALEQMNGEVPTHVFLQAGVGAMSGAITAYFAARFGEEDRPIITIVEPNKADCIYRSAKAGNVTPQVVKGDMQTIMAGLACGEPCTIGWKILRDHADNFISMPDYYAAKGMRVLGNPMGDDRRVISGESGASTMGFVAEVLQNENLSEVKEMLKLNEHSKVLCFSTEGDTDRENYRRIVWDGYYPSF